VIDDDDAVREVLEHFLLSLGYVVMTATNGVEGLAVLQKRRPDAVPELPVAMVTANAEESLAKATLRDGAFDYVMKPVEVTKPLDVSRLLAILDEHLAIAGR
jgi:CheY-like chemotaxis protein